MVPDSIFQQTLKWEKGYVNVQHDKGGLTNDGITFSHYTANCEKALGRKPSYKHFQRLTIDEKRAFYDLIWQRLWCDKIENTLVAGVCFDFGVNSSYAKREIQEVLQELGYKLKADNIFGPVTVKALNAAVKKTGASDIIKAILDKRQAYVESLDDKDPTQTKFMKGWNNRINDWRSFAEAELKTNPQTPILKPVTDGIATNGQSPESGSSTAA